MRHVLTILAVDDVSRSAAFYERAFGWRRAVDVPVYVEFELPGDGRLGVYERRGFGRNTGSVPSPTPAGSITGTELYFRSDDLAGSIAALRAAGARELSGASLRDWGEEVAYFADPDGNVIAVARLVDRVA